jgi:hypothetical protein
MSATPLASARDSRFTGQVGRPRLTSLLRDTGGWVLSFTPSKEEAYMGIPWVSRSGGVPTPSRTSIRLTLYFYYEGLTLYLGYLGAAGHRGSHFAPDQCWTHSPFPLVTWGFSGSGIP